MLASHMLHVSIVNISAQLSEAIYRLLDEGFNPDTFVRVNLSSRKAEYGKERLSASHTSPLCSN